MSRLVFDIETNGFLDVLDRIHCLWLHDLDTEQYHSFTDDCDEYPSIEEGLTMLSQADMVAGHFILGFDLPAIQKVHPEFKLKEGCVVRDTVLMSELMYSNLRDLDFARYNKEKPKRERGETKGIFPGQFIGRHSLESWGHRLREHKGDYSKEMKAKGLDPWAEWNPAMHDYCGQDVKVNVKLWHILVKQGWSDRALDIEHRFRQLMIKMMDSGFPFREKDAVELYGTLGKERAKVLDELQTVFPAFYKRDGKRVTPQKSLSYKDPLRADRTSGASFTPVVLTEFNPGSRQHIANRLKFKYGWKPEQFTEDGNPKLDEDVLSDLPYPEAKLVGRYLMLEKRIGQLAEGKQAWLKKCRSSVHGHARIHGRISTAGAVTRRCTHSDPNLGQVPSLKNAKGEVPFGRECRRLFYAPEGWQMVGVDASGLELRCLAHYLAKYDDGKYAELVLHGDVHTANMEAMGLSDRSLAKTVTYATLYGSGNANLGAIIGKGPAAGKKLKDRWFKGIPALGRLMEDIATSVKKRKGRLKAIDGGWLHVRKEHAALNTILQSTGAIACKLAPVLMSEELERRGWTYGEDWELCAHVHDEWQALVRPHLVDEYKQVAVESIRQAGTELGFRLPLDGEAKSGADWSETH